MNRIRYRIVMVLAALLAAGCSSNTNSSNSNSSIEHNGGLIHIRNEGYGLLYGLMTDESKVSGLLTFKSASDPVKKIVNEISEASKQARQQLDGYVTAESRIVINESDLPKVEQESRDLESKRDAKELLFSSGNKFELSLVFTQAQATGYAANLCAALAAREDDAGRKQYLVGLGQQFAGFRVRLMGMLAIQG